MCPGRIPSRDVVPANVENKDVGSRNFTFVSSCGCYSQGSQLSDNKFGVSNPNMVNELVRSIARIGSCEAASCTNDAEVETSIVNLSYLISSC
jgi:hypothetical protein